MGLAAGDDAGVPPAAGDTGAAGAATLIGKITGPRSGSEMAARVPFALIAMGPSSGPRDSGKGLRTAAVGFSPYHAPVPSARTALKPPAPGAAPSVNNAAGVGGLASTFGAAGGSVRSDAAYSLLSPPLAGPARDTTLNGWGGMQHGRSAASTACRCQEQRRRQGGAPGSGDPHVNRRS